MDAGADVEEGFAALARGVLDGGRSGRRRRYRSRARRAVAASSMGEATPRDPTPEETHASSSALCERILRLARAPGGRLEQIRREIASQPPAGPRRAPAPPREGGYVDASSGMRLRYASWGAPNDPTVLLLHGLGESGEAWSAVAAKLAAHSYRALTVDLRGHGQSSWQSGGRYAIGAMADDIRDVFLRLDLYTAPVAVVGRHLGAVCALDFAARYPGLAAGAVAIDLPLPPGDGAAVADLVSCPAIQGAGGGVVTAREEALALLTSPLIGAQRRSLSAAQRTIDVAFTFDALCGRWNPKMDPKFQLALPADGEPLGRRALARLTAPLVVMHAAPDGPEAASALRESLGHLRESTEAATVRAVPLAHSNGSSLQDCPFDVYLALKASLEKFRFEVFSDAERRARTPEALGLRPLATFGSVEEARRALGPRRVPMAADVEAALAQLRAEEGKGPGAASSDSEEEASRSSLTALAHNPAEYFGMVG